MIGNIHPKVLWAQVIGWGMVVVAWAASYFGHTDIPAYVALAMQNVLLGIVGYQVASPPSPPAVPPIPIAGAKP